MNRLHIAAFLTMTALPAGAEVVIEPGSFFMIHRDYDHKTNTFADGAPEGEGEACFRINAVDLPTQRIDVELISGDYTPWWSEETYTPGFTDTYLPGEAFMENNPGTDWTALLRQIWKTVPSCPDGAS